MYARGMPLAQGQGTGTVNRRIVLFVTGIVHIDNAVERKQMTVPRVTAGHHAVKQSTTAGDRFEDIAGVRLPSGKRAYLWAYTAHGLK
jgi:hypothetical protein